MECNKDEAIRAKAIAEAKLEKKDFGGAKKFAQKAQSLYPQLEGVSQMLTTIDVYVSSENRIGGEVDWYGLLGVNPTADDETVKKQYRKLALMLHPDKNKSVGADGAFKLLCEAWSLLSDKAKRLAYNQRRFQKGFQQNVSVHKSGPSATPCANGFHAYTSRTSSAPKTSDGNNWVPPTSAPKTSDGGNRVPPTSAPKTSDGNNRVPPTSAPKTLDGNNWVPPTSVPKTSDGNNLVPPTSAPKTSHGNNRVPPTSAHRPSYQRTDTFWTICHRCKMHYEYLKIYLNHTLLCPNCHGAFLASETASPFNYSKSTNPSSNHRHQNSSNYAPSSNSVHPGRSATSATKDSRPGPMGHHSLARTNFQQDPLLRTASIGSMDPSIAAKAANVVQQAHEKMKRERDSSESAAGWEGNSGYSSASVGEGPYKKTRLDGDGYHYGANMTYNWPTGNDASTSAPRKSGYEADRIYGFSGTCNKPLPNSIRELAPVEVRNMLMEKSRKEILKKLDESRSQTSNKAVDTEKLKVKESKNGKGRSTFKSHRCDLNGTFKSSATQRADQAEKYAVSTDAGDAENTVAATMSVPDPDFHDFDLDRTESSFEENEVWAAYDDDDGMPRFYAMINKVISRKPFKVRINFLNSKSTSEFGAMDWVGSGFYKTCGEFRLGKYEINKSINSFSHKVKWSKGMRGVVHILPRKGDVWALYRNWSPDWNENTPDEVIHKYDMVVVLDDYSEEQGISVAPLIKVAGFKTVFLPHPDPEKIKKIPREEMFRLSHQVPNYLLSGEEAQNVPKGSLELDPAATPLELLQVLTDANEGNLPEIKADRDSDVDLKIKDGEDSVKNGEDKDQGEEKSESK